MSEHTICEQCGVDLTAIRERTGQPAWPFCPHGKVGGDEQRSAYVPDEIPGGMVINNAGPEPVTVYSYTEMNQLFASRGLSRLEKFSPTPGTSKDPAGVQDPAKYMDPYTLANGAALILRSQGSASAAREAEDKAFGERAYRPLPDRVLTESEAREAHRAIAEREEVKRGRS